MARVISEISELRAQSGSTMEGYEISLRAGLDITDQPFCGDGRTPLRGSPNQISADLTDYADAGLTYLALEPRAESPEQFLQQLERFSQLPKP